MSRLKLVADYLIHSDQSLLVIEAKNADMDRGFTQLAMALIALDHYQDEQSSDCFYGAVTIGDMWRFGCLDRQEKRIIKNIDAFVIPANLEDLFSVFFGILQR